MQIPELRSRPTKSVSGGGIYGAMDLASRAASKSGAVGFVVKRNEQFVGGICDLRG